MKSFTSSSHVLLSVILLTITVWHTPHQVAAQDEEIEPNYIGEEGRPGLPPRTILDGEVVELNTLNEKIQLEHSETMLNCAEGRMDITIRFKDRFHGIVYANNTPDSPCRVNGNGSQELSMHIALHSCGTTQDPKRVFTNNIHIRFNPYIHQQYDEVVTVVCRYPPPFAPLPATNLRFVKSTPPPAPVILPAISGHNIIVIICAILFLSLLLLGLGFGYACMKRRRVSLIRKVPPPGLPPSDITQLEMPFDALKIPRAHAVPFMDDVTSSETIPSDYPSESMSELEEVDMGPAIVPGGTPNRSYLLTEHLLNTTLTDKTIREEIDIHRPPQPAVVPKPVQQTLVTSEQLLTRTLTNQQLEDTSEIRRGAATISQHQAEVHNSAVSGYDAAAAFRVLPPSPPRSFIDSASASDNPDGNFSELYATVQRGSAQHHSVDDLLCSTVTETKVCEDVEQYRRAVKEYYARKQQPMPSHWDVQIRQYMQERERADSSSSHWDESSVGTDVPPLPRLKSRVELDGAGRPMSSWTGTTADHRREQTHDLHVHRHLATINDIQTHRETRHEELFRTEEPIRPTTRDFTPPKRLPPPMDVFIRILEAPHEYDECLSVLTDDDRTTLRELVTHEETFRTMLSRARVVEDFERIRNDSRFSRLLSAKKWDVIFRVMVPTLVEPALSEFSETTRAPSDVPDYTEMSEPQVEFRMSRGRHYAEHATLPPVYEDDVIGADIHHARSTAGSVRSHVTARSSYRGDVRSMTEETVNFHRYAASIDGDAASSSVPVSAAAAAADMDAPRERLVASRLDLLQQWNTLPTLLGYGDGSSGGDTRQERVPGGVSRAPPAPSTVGDREELYSMAETDVDWQKR